MTHLTLLWPSDESLILAKQFSIVDEEFYKKDYDGAFLCGSSEIEFNTIEELFAILDYIKNNPRQCVIRGQSALADNEEILRRGESSETPYFIDVPINWVCFDIDKLDAPVGILESEIPQYLLAMEFSDEFQDSDYIFQHSSSSGLNGFSKVSGHFWFMLEHPLTAAELRLWGDFVSWKDPSTFKSVQPHYTATPLFTNMTDPITDRYVLVKKDNRFIELIIPTVAQVNTVLTNNTIAAGFDPSSGYMQYVAQITASGGHPFIVRSISSYWGSFGTNCDWNWMIDVIKNQMIKVGHPRAGSSSLDSELKNTIRDVKKKYAGGNKLRYKDIDYVQYKLRSIINVK